MTILDLEADEYNPYYQKYIDKSKNLNLNDFSLNFDHVLSFLQDIPKEKHEYRYEKDKWTVKEVVLHMIDAERIFAYRALRIARKDQTLLPGFDQDAYVATSQANNRTFVSLLKEYISVKTATITLFDHFDDEMQRARGTASNSTISVRALGFIIMGHENHHVEILNECYL